MQEKTITKEDELEKRSSSEGGASGYNIIVAKIILERVCIHFTRALNLTLIILFESS